VDAFLAVASKREVRGYSDRPVPDAAVRRILEAGRIAGSSRNRQPWRFLVVGDQGVRERVAEAVFAPVGRTIRVPESQQDAVTALSGNGPAYFFYRRATCGARRWWWRWRCGEADRWLSTLAALRRT